MEKIKIKLFTLMCIPIICFGQSNLSIHEISTIKNKIDFKKVVNENGFIKDYEGVELCYGFDMSYDKKASTWAYYNLNTLGVSFVFYNYDTFERIKSEILSYCRFHSVVEQESYDQMCYTYSVKENNRLICYYTLIDKDRKSYVISTFEKNLLD